MKLIRLNGQRTAPHAVIVIRLGAAERAGGRPVTHKVKDGSKNAREARSPQGINFEARCRPLIERLLKPRWRETDLDITADPEPR
jgi:hypothetical protein